LGGIYSTIAIPALCRDPPGGCLRGKVLNSEPAAPWIPAQGRDDGE